MSDNKSNLRLTVKEKNKRMRNCVVGLCKADAITVDADTDKSSYRFFRVERIRRSSSELTMRDMFENVISSVKDPDFNYVYILTGSPSGVTIHMGICRGGNSENSDFKNPWNYGDILSGSFKGNLPGSCLVPEDNSNGLLETMADYPRRCMITGVPGVEEDDSGRKLRQGLDLLINSCTDMNWRLVVTARPVSCEGILRTYEALCELYNDLSRASKNSVQVSESSQVSSAVNVSDSVTKSHNEGKGGGTDIGESIHYSSDHTESRTGHENWSTGDSSSKQHTAGTSDTTGKGGSASVGYELINKFRMELMDYLDERVLKRYRYGIGRGMFRTNVYLMSDNLSDLSRVRSLFCAVYGGDEKELDPPSYADMSFLSEEEQLRVVRSLLNDMVYVKAQGAEQLIFGHKTNGKLCSTSTIMTSRELAAIAGIPENEVVGIPYVKGGDFGLNTFEHSRDILLGHIINSGIGIPQKKVWLPYGILNRHVLVAGVTGSGKTTTCQQLITDADCPFLVIEPAKTEYRALLNTALGDRIMIYTLGNESNSPFRLNPFELIPGENFTSHVDMLTATFTSAFPMEAAMPQLLEEAIYRCYEKYGWNASSGTNIYTDDPFTEDGRYFPIMSDLVITIPEVVKEKRFSVQMEGDYVGSLRGRIANLLTGSKGCMLNCRRSVDFCDILDRYVILELEDLRSGSDKAFIMGLIMARLAESLKLRHSRSHGYRHITLVEEAHRLLSKTEPGDSGAKRSAVESFTDLLAEVRKYGESLIIADQIPNKLASDVLKNTNTKIIHKLFATDDKNALGEAMMMDEEQKSYLSLLIPGEAVLFTESTPGPINIMVKRSTDTSEEVDGGRIKELFSRMRKMNDRLIADGSVFGSMKSSQRHIIEGLYVDMRQFFDRVGKRKSPDEETERKELLAFSEAYHKKIADMSARADMGEDEVLEEIIWRYMIEKGFVMKYFSDLGNVREVMKELFDGLFVTLPEEGVIPKDAIRKFNNL